MNDEPRQRLPTRARAMWGVQVAGLGLVAALVAGPALGGLWGVLTFAAGVVLALVVPHVYWRRWRYEVREEEIDLRHGLWTVRRTLVPIRRVQHVDTESGPIQSACDLATVTFHTAAGKTRIPAVGRTEADAIRRRVAELARTRDDV